MSADHPDRIADDRHPNCGCAGNRAAANSECCPNCGIPFGPAGRYWPKEELPALPDFDDFFPDHPA